MTLFKPHDSATGRTIYLGDMNRGGTFLSEPSEVEVFQASIDEWWGNQREATAFGRTNGLADGHRTAKQGLPGLPPDSPCPGSA
ncbi:hypothetical protein ABZ733_30080 [Streptomyces longwoodensis]|uniref:hypothetical protein n=1 Tax=Streptomyces longwoodensis TaxID=68231 RepID=UPI00340796E1